MISTTDLSADKIAFHVESWQCQHLFVACCHDAGYAPQLSQFATSKKLTLVDAGLFHPRLASLEFPKIHLPGLFEEPMISEVVAMANGKEQPVKPFRHPYALQARLKPVLIDKKTGTRYDKPLKPKPELVRKLQGLKLCYQYHLVGECKGCDKTHSVDRKLTPDEFDALWSITRRGQCYKDRKKQCEDALCIYGHR